jgi:hypothetical protein
MPSLNKQIIIQMIKLSKIIPNHIENYNLQLTISLTHLPGFFWHAILSKVEGFSENFELPEVYLHTS